MSNKDKRMFEIDSKIMEKATEETKDLALQSMEDVEKEFGDTTWVWESWLGNGLVTMIVSDSGVGKTTVCIDLASRIISGGFWPDNEPVDSTDIGWVLWVECESLQGPNAKRFQRFEIPLNRVKILPLGDVAADTNLDNQKHWNTLLGVAQRPEIKLIIIDSLSGAHSKDENANESREVLKGLAALAKKVNKPILITHHIRKSNSDEASGIIRNTDCIRGTSTFKQFCRVIIALDKPDSKGDVLRMRQIKNNLAKMPPPLAVSISENGVHYDSEAPIQPVAETKVTKAAEIIRKFLQSGPKGATDVKNHLHGLGFYESAINRARTLLKKQDEITVDQIHDKSEKRIASWMWQLKTQSEENDLQDMKSETIISNDDSSDNWYGEDESDSVEQVANDNSEQDVKDSASQEEDCLDQQDEDDWAT
jgi:hypothetical protein